MDELPVIRITLYSNLTIDIYFLQLLEWEGEICNDCSSNVFTFAFGLDIYPATGRSSVWSIARYKLCVSCHSIPHYVAYETARVITESYGNISGSVKRAG